MYQKLYHSYLNLFSLILLTDYTPFRAPLVLCVYEKSWTSNSSHYRNNSGDTVGKNTFWNLERCFRRILISLVVLETIPTYAFCPVITINSASLHSCICLRYKFCGHPKYSLLARFILLNYPHAPLFSKDKFYYFNLKF